MMLNAIEYCLFLDFAISTKFNFDSSEKFEEDNIFYHEDIQSGKEFYDFLKSRKELYKTFYVGSILFEEGNEQSFLINFLIKEKAFQGFLINIVSSKGVNVLNDDFLKRIINAPISQAFLWRSVKSMDFGFWLNLNTKYIALLLSIKEGRD